MNMRRFLILLLSAVLLASCAVMRAPARLERLVDRVERSADRYTPAQWQRANRQYESLVKEYIHNYRRYTTQEKRTAMSAIGRYHALLVDHGIKESVGFIGSLGSYVGGLIDILKQDSGAVLDFIQDVLGIRGGEARNLSSKAFFEQNLIN